MDSMRSLKKGMRAATRKVTSSTHAALHNIIEEEADIRQALNHVAQERQDSATYMTEWAATTDDDLMVNLASGLAPLHARQVEAEARFLLAQDAYVAVWRELLGKERIRDKAKVRVQKCQANLTKLQQKLEHATPAKRPGLEQKVATAQQLHQEALAEYQPIADETRAHTRSAVTEGCMALNQAYMTMLQDCLQAAQERQAILESIQGGGGGGGGLLAQAASRIPVAMPPVFGGAGNDDAPPPYQ